MDANSTGHSTSKSHSCSCGRSRRINSCKEVHISHLCLMVTYTCGTGVDAYEEHLEHCQTH